MPRYLLLLLVLFAFACRNNTTPSADKQPVSNNDFFDVFKKLQLPYTVADTNLLKATDSTQIGYDVLKQVVPDSALQTLNVKKPGNLLIRPIGKIETEDGIYLLVTVTDGKKSQLITYLFNKKKQYLGHLLLLSNQTADHYTHSVAINTEPTLLITREKTINNQYRYTKNGYAYSKENKGFVEVINDSNEDDQNKDVINPIDTLAKQSKYSGDYVEDKRNFISIRDGSNAKKYVFFIHFEKGKEKENNACTGELKGTMTMVSDNGAVFQQNGDPCVIDFTFEKNNRIKVKERGSCGNHRGMTCMFDDTYKKKVPPSVKGKKKK